MSTALVSSTAASLAPQGPPSFPQVPWRDVHDVSPAELTAYIRQLEQACLENPKSADLRTCLGMAYAVNYDVYKSMDALEDARTVDSGNFWAQMKYAELHYRLRALNRAEEETRRAMELAANPFQLAVARRQMKEIRGLKHSSIRNVEWTKPLTMPAIVFSAMIAVLLFVMLWR
jgi:hypothetical protein